MQNDALCGFLLKWQAKDSSPTGVSRFSTRSNAVGLIQTEANAKKVFVIETIFYFFVFVKFG